MYHSELIISIFSQTSWLSEMTRSIALQERFEHRIRTCSALSEDALRDADLILFDLPVKDSPQNLRTACKEGALLIICASREEIEGLCDEAFAAADGYWEKPENRRLCSLRLSGLLGQIKMKKELHIYRSCLDTAINSIPDMVWFKDLSGIHLKVNDAFCRAVGKPMEDVAGKGHCSIWNVSPDDPESGEMVCKQSEDVVIEKRKTCQFAERVKTQHGMRQFRTYKSPLYDENGDIMGTVGIGHDITDIENMGAELAIILQSMPFAILICSEQGTIITANDKVEKYFGIDRGKILGKAYDEWVGEVFDEPKRINTEGYVEAGIRGAVPPRILEIHESPIHDVFQNTAGQICIYRDVTMERELERQILHNSNTDFLTGLYNRRCFYQYIHNNRGGKPISLLYVDLDCFKKINDTFGHKVGDKALIITADVLRECFGKEFISRIGGDEFLIAIMGECSTDQLRERAQHFIRRIQETFRETPPLTSLSASVGISATSDPNVDIDMLIQESDAALYEAKQSGRARYVIFHREPHPAKNALPVSRQGEP